MPGMPDMMKCGMLPSLAMILRRSTVSVLPTMSSRKTGRYFSTLQRCQWGFGSAVVGILTRGGRSQQRRLRWL